MSLKHLLRVSLERVRVAFVAMTVLQVSLAGPIAAPLQAQEDSKTTSPIKHVIVIIGENRTFDHIFATYKPKKGESVKNLLSEGIVNDDGSRGPNYSLAEQFSAKDTHAEKYQVSPMNKSVYKTLPPPLTGGPSDVCKNNGICSVSDAEASENGLPLNPPTYYESMTQGGTEQSSGVPDTRIQNVTDLDPGPFQLTSSTFPYNSYAASPVHRFYQMWQQLDCNYFTYSTVGDASGCKADLFPWVEVTVGAGTNGKPQPTGFNEASTGEGSTSMGFYNMDQGDAPYLEMLADNYAMSDNYHQAVMGGTGANHIMMGTGDAIWFSDGNGNPKTPPHNAVVRQGTSLQGTVDEIENPNAQPGTNNWYTEDGYGGGGPSFVLGKPGTPVYGGGSYSNCSDSDAPGVTAVLNFLATLPYEVDPHCDPGHYYLLNNYNPGYFGDGSNAYTDTNEQNTPFTIPPSNVRNIGDALLEKNISWAYFGDQFNAYLNDKYQSNYGTVGTNSDQYCNICNFFQYSTSIMTNAAVRTAHLKDTVDLYADIQNGTLPAVSFVKPSGWVDGHPASSKLDLFEGFVKKIVDEVQANPTLWASTAIFITFDEGGGYYDSGYVQPLDFFGDGTRIPLMVVSPFTKPGHVSHDYTDHVSILKFIERNWDLDPLTKRSRDNFPNPKYNKKVSQYVPTNSPAIGDLFDLFDFSKSK
ncbi:MAG TPA: alkaline phosphatase family protein [Candidatus Acidoferrales bacterium]|jgi:phospholipase C|nr:alkaline phosphatase family protein [Candidatus Acidoferrales bacterium]